MYSPTLGRFMQTDLIGYADGMNWYAYVGNDPINFVDPLGLARLIRTWRKVCSVTVDGVCWYVDEFDLDDEAARVDDIGPGLLTNSIAVDDILGSVCVLGAVAEVGGELFEDNILEGILAGAAIGGMAGSPATMLGGAAMGASVMTSYSQVGTVGQFMQDFASADSLQERGIGAARALVGSIGRPTRGIVNAFGKVGDRLGIDTLRDWDEIFDASIDAGFSDMTGEMFDPENQC